MARLEDLEKASQAASGELTGDEARELADQLDFERAVQAMRAIDRAAAELRKPLAGLDVDALVARTLPPPPRRIWRRAAMGAVAVAAAAMVAIFPGNRALGYALVELSPGVRVNGVVVSGSVRLKRGDRVETADGHAVLTDGKGRIVLAAGTAIRLEDVPELIRGTAEASGESTALRSERHDLRIAGRAIVTLEPLDALLRVSSADTTEGIMKINILKLGAAAGGLATIGAVALLVTDGKATINAPSGASVELDAGQRWTAGEAKPHRYETPPPPAAPLPNDTVAAVAPSSGPVRLTIAANDPAKMSREELVAEVKRLRDSKRSVDEEMAAKDDDKLMNMNHHRFTKDQLVRMAKRGRLNLRIPFDKGRGFSLKPKQRSKAGVSEAEYNLIRSIYDDSHERVVAGLTALCREVGCDPKTRAANDLMSAIVLNTPGGEEHSIVAQRLITQERAGLVATGRGGTPVERMYRLLWTEDDRIIDEMDALLGADRAASLLNHPDAGGSRWSSEVGGPNEKDTEDDE